MREECSEGETTSRETWAVDARRPLAPTVDDLIARATSREPMESADSKSGARFERVTVDGEPFVLKHVDLELDWIARQTGDIGCWPVIVWEAGIVDLAPDVIDHTIVGAARTRTGGAVLMRDVGDYMVPSDDSSVALDLHLELLDRLAAFHAACWGWQDTIGLCPLSNRYSFFGPEALACEAALGFPEPVPRLAAEGWDLLTTVAPGTDRALAPLRLAPWPLFGRARAHAADVPPRRLEAGQPRPRARRSHHPRRLVTPGFRPAARRARALPRAERGAAPGRPQQGRRDRGVPRVAHSSRRRHCAVVGRTARPVPARCDAPARVEQGARRPRRRARLVDGPRRPRRRETRRGDVTIAAPDALRARFPAAIGRPRGTARSARPGASSSLTARARRSSKCGAAAGIPPRSTRRRACGGCGSTCRCRTCSRPTTTTRSSGC